MNRIEEKMENRFSDFDRRSKIHYRGDKFPTIDSWKVEKTNKKQTQTKKTFCTKDTKTIHKICILL